MSVQVLTGRVTLPPPPVTEVYATRKGSGWLTTYNGVTIWSGNPESMDRRLTWIGCPKPRRIHMEGGGS